MRKRFWLFDNLAFSQVEGLVQEDSRVDRYPMIVKGESRVVWEWQGMENTGTCFIE